MESRLKEVHLVGEHQREGCMWMLEKELALENIQSENEEKIAGGILADEVGLGKTYMAAGLIRANPVKLTLIVTLVNIQSQWQTILRDFAYLRVGNLATFLSSVPIDRMNEDNFGVKGVYVIVTTYSQMRARPEWAMKTKWDRIILDEGHLIRNPKTTSFSSIKSLQSNKRWVLTATPIHNGIRDLVSLFEWIGFVSSEEANGLNRKKKRKHENGGGVDVPSPSEDAEQQHGGGSDDMTLSQMTQKYMLRRTLASEKYRTNELCLPELEEHTELLDWKSDYEKALYDKVHNTMYTHVMSLQKDKTVRRNATIQAIMRLRQISVSFEVYEQSLNAIHDEQNIRKQNLEELKEADPHVFALNNAFYRAMCTLNSKDKEEDDSRFQKDDENASGNVYPSRALDDYQKSRDVAINMDDDDRKRENEMIQIYKLAVYKLSEQEDKTALVLANAALDQNKERERKRKERAQKQAPFSRITGRRSEQPPPQLELIEEVKSTHTRPRTSTKIQRLCDMLKTDCEDKANKIIVFTSFIEEMKIIWRAMQEAGIDCNRLYGGMNTLERSDAIDTFIQRKDKRILVAQIMCSSTGINLQCANIIYITSPTWNPCIETQAVGRVYRQGQSRKVRVMRMVMKDSIEQKCLEIQEQKRGIINDRLPAAASSAAAEEAAIASAF